MAIDNGHITSVFGESDKKTACVADTMDLSTMLTPLSNQIDSRLPNEPNSAVWRTFATCQKLFLSCLPSLVPVLLTFVMYMLGKDYVRQWVLWLEDQTGWVVCMTFGALYTAVSFPVVWGYLVLNLACGYHFGLVCGFLMTVFGACVGLSIAHVTMGLCSGFLRKHMVRHKAVNILLQFLRGQKAFRVIIASRLSPIPFGIQNAVFAISGVKLVVYLGASTVGLLPTQALNVYLGSTLRSLEEVLMDERPATTAYLVVLAQVAFSILLMTIIIRSGKLELKESLVTPV